VAIQLDLSFIAGLSERPGPRGLAAVSSRVGFGGLSMRSAIWS